MNNPAVEADFDGGMRSLEIVLPDAEGDEAWDAFNLVLAALRTAQQRDRTGTLKAVADAVGKTLDGRRPEGAE